MFFNNMNMNIDNTSYYKLLGIDKNATKKEVVKAYRKKAMKEHPDKGGDPEKFKEVTKAYEVLSDDNKRSAYDSGGIDAVEGNGGMSMGSDIFSMFNMGNNVNKRSKKSKPIEFNLNVTLNELYKGNNRKLRINRKLIDKDSIDECNYCGGKGVIIKTIRMGNMIQQMQSTCDYCGGKGKNYKINKVKEEVNITIPKGAPNKHKIILYEKGDDILDGETGDIHVILNEVPHHRFKRHGSDLYLEKTISLYEALCGFTFKVKHLDDREFLTKSSDIIKPIKFDPLSDSTEWEFFENHDCTLEAYAKAKISDINKIKELLNTELKKENISGFVISNNETHFYKNNVDELRCNKVKGNSMFYVKMNNGELLHCIENEGLEVLDNPLLKGNLFIKFNIEFPDFISSETKELLKNSEIGCNSDIKNDDNLEILELTKKDPIKSFNENKDENESYEDDESQESEGVQCAQQ